jgi:4-hydroxyphenylpyruvate dioxygenase
MKYSIATVCLSGTLREKLEAIAKAGFSAVEMMENDLMLFDGPVSDIKKITDDLGLEIITYQPLRDFEGLPEPYRSKVFSRAERKLDMMGELGCDLLMACSTTSPHSLGGIQRVVDDYCELADLAKSRNMRVAFEALSWGRHINDYRDSWEVVRRGNHEALGLCLDTFHIFSRGVEIDSLCNIPGDKIFLVQLADAPKLTMDPLSWSRHYRCFPGQGELPVAEFVKNLKTTGYDGPLSLEIFNDQFRAGSVEANAKDGYRSLVYINSQTEIDDNKPLVDVNRPWFWAAWQTCVKKCGTLATIPD